MSEVNQRLLEPGYIDPCGTDLDNHQNSLGGKFYFTLSIECGLGQGIQSQNVQTHSVSDLVQHLEYFLTHVIR